MQVELPSQSSHSPPDHTTAQSRLGPPLVRPLVVQLLPASKLGERQRTSLLMLPHSLPSLPLLLLLMVILVGECHASSRVCSLLSAFCAVVHCRRLLVLLKSWVVALLHRRVRRATEECDGRRGRSGGEWERERWTSGEGSGSRGESKGAGNVSKASVT